MACHGPGGLSAGPRAEGFDGITAKRLFSPHLPGRRTRDWITIKRTTAIDDGAPEEPG
ncbi:hypothetical protein [Streptomyces sp. WAC02707]|uniref:hypothetical protein n=1 Tax=Streptomyces sp. WAC02707 TaxID=2487417 RepID=UPI00163C378D|nr:hypothetical protein [Streptomyces sp. WAC02707]